MKLSGYTICRNAIDLDYCVVQTVLSLLPVCDEVIVCDSDSTDGTIDAIRALGVEVKIINWPWPNPFDNKTWLTEWINFTRGHCSHPAQLQLDADEVLHEDSYPEIRRSVEKGDARWFHRLNFWGDTRYMAPSGYVCGDKVARLGPTKFFMPSDEPHPEGEPEIRKYGTIHPDLRIFHYGFLRHAEAFYRKSDVVQTAFFGNMDDRLKRCAKTGENWVQACPFPQPLQHFHGTHPAIAHDWLRARGYHELHIP